MCIYIYIYIERERERYFNIHALYSQKEATLDLLAAYIWQVTAGHEQVGAVGVYVQDAANNYDQTNIIKLDSQGINQ